jgi:hypothetical protein
VADAAQALPLPTPQSPRGGLLDRPPRRGLSARQGALGSPFRWPAIVDMVQDQLALSDGQLEASRGVLAEYGNCSSAILATGDGPARCCTRAFRLVNHAYREARVTLQLLLEADFAGTGEAVAGKAQHQTPVRRHLDAARRELWFTDDRDGLDRATLIRLDAGVGEVGDDGECLHLPVTVSARGEHLIEFLVLARANGETKRAPKGGFQAPTALHQLTRRLVDGARRNSPGLLVEVPHPARS